MTERRVIKNRRGSSMLEAALVLPHTILVIITIVLIIMFFYSQSVTRSNMHMALRCEAGVTTCTQRYSDAAAKPLHSEDLWSGNITSSGIMLKKRLTAEDNISIIRPVILTKPGSVYLSGSVYAVSGSAVSTKASLSKHEKRSTRRY